MVDFDARIVVLALRIAQTLLAILVLALSAFVVHWWSAYWHKPGPSALAFLVFSSVWTFLALAYLILVPWRFSDTKAHHKLAILGAEAVTMLFWFAGFVAVAVWLTGRECWGGVCEAVKAALVFAVFEWLCFVATTVMAAIYVWRTHDRRWSSRGDKADPDISLRETV